MSSRQISDEKIEQIRSALLTGEKRDDIARRLGVSQGFVSKVKFANRKAAENGDTRTRSTAQAVYGNRAAVVDDYGERSDGACPSGSRGNDHLLRVATVSPKLAAPPVVQTHLLLPDLHFPDYHKGLWRAILDFLDRNRVHGITWTGDQLSLDEISHHNQDKPGLKGKGALKANLDGFAELLNELDARLTHGALKRWHYGNHERFVQDLYDQSPELEGMLDFENLLGLKARGYEVFKLGKMSELGSLGVIHGDQVGSGKYVANKLVEAFCTNVVMGHVHTASSITKVAAANTERKWTGTTLPTMGTVKPAYARNRINPHVNGFGIVELLGSGQFNLYTIIADSGTGGFSYGGQYYCGRV